MEVHCFIIITYEYYPGMNLFDAYRKYTIFGKRFISYSAVVCPLSNVSVVFSGALTVIEKLIPSL